MSNPKWKQETRNKNRKTRSTRSTCLCNFYQYIHPFSKV